MTGKSATRSAKTHGRSLVLEAEGRWVKTMKTEVETVVMVIRRWRMVAWRKYSAEMKTPRARPTAMEKRRRSSTMYLMGMMEVAAARERRIADISSQDGQVGLEVMKP